jgi:hypothetical protein
MSNISSEELVGKRVKLIEMFEDPFPIEPGAEGTVLSIGADVIMVQWDNGRKLGMIDGVDQFKVIS